MPATSQSLRLLATVVTALAVTAAYACAQAPVPCDKAEAPLHAEAVAEVRRQISTNWLDAGHNYYIGYRMKSPPANPFDLTTPKAPGAKQVEEGYIWVAGLACHLTTISDTEITITLQAGAASFAEKGARWTPPLYDKQLTQFILTRRETQWAVRENRGEDSVLTAEDELRRPAAEELPPRNKKIGIPCAPEQVWERRRCVAAAKAKAPHSF
ncbi:MAG: hypothetical protein ACKVP3_16090 [Hyphomicrobiaceae bacterium]